MKTQLKIYTFLIFLTVPALCLAATPSHKKAANTLLEMMEMANVVNHAADQMLDIQIKQTPQLKPFKNVLKKFIIKYAGFKSLKKQYIKIYTDTFTEKELKEMIAFYKTPTGKKAIKMMPVLMTKGAELGSKQVELHQAELIEMIKAKQQELQN